MFPRIYERLFSYIIPSSVIVFILEVNKDNEIIKKRLKEIEDEENKLSIDNLKFIKEI
jgi:hypothetical protein